VAVVDQNGLVQGVGEGRAIISAAAKKEGHILSFAREVVVNVIPSDSRFCPYNYNITNYIPPFLYFQALPTGAPMSVTFFIEAYDPDGGNLVIGMFDADGDGNWEIQQSLEIPYISGSFEWIYNSTGIFTAKIQVVDDEGQISTKSIPLFIQEHCLLKLLWRDSDGDGYGNPNLPAISCHQIYGYVENNLDCDDQNMRVNPSSEEICNGIDDNCNGNIDEGVETPLSIIFGGGGFDFIINIGNGEYIAGGYSVRFSGQDAFIMKINESGQIMWSKFIYSHISGLSGAERFNSGIVDIDGNIVLAGEAEHFIRGFVGRKAFVVKMNREGEIIWSKIIAGSDDNIVGGGEARTYIVQDFDGNYIIAGTIQKRYGDKDMYIAKLNRSGEVQWFRTIGGIYDDFAYSVKVDSAGNYIVVGKTNSFGFGMDDIFAVKLNSNGEIIWAKAIGGSSIDFAAHVLVKGNSYIIAGGTESLGIGKYDIYLLKLNESGDIIWSNAIGGPENELALHSILDKYGNVIAVGWIESVGPDDAFVLEISDSGMLNWAKYIGAGVVDGLTGITQKDDGKFFMVGGSYFMQRYTGLSYYGQSLYLSEFDPYSGCACKVIDISRYLCGSSGGYSVDVNPIVQSIYQLSYDVATTSFDVTFDLFHLCQ
jgi:hypothetical protein